MALLLSREKNPFFEHAQAEYFLAERDGEVVGRIAAIGNRLHNETHGDRVGFFGFFESVDDQAVADQLFQAAADWCRQRGHDLLRGPASFSVNDECAQHVHQRGLEAAFAARHVNSRRIPLSPHRPPT